MATETSCIEEFFAGRTVLLTGSTGFLGKLLLQKLLRACPRVHRLYLIIRQKKDRDAEQRLERILDNPVFDALKREVPTYRDKLRVVCGDVRYEGLGLGSADRAALVEEVEVVLHSAATVDFEQPLRDAVTTNVQGTREVLLLCAQMRRLRAAVVVSTAYSFCPRARIGEYFMRPPIRPETAIALARDMDEAQLEEIKRKLVGRWPNTYAATQHKAKRVRVRFIGAPSRVLREIKNFTVTMRRVSVPKRNHGTESALPVSGPAERWKPAAAELTDY